MPTEVNLRRILDRKQWEMVSGSPITNGQNGLMIPSATFEQYCYLIRTATEGYAYDPSEDSFMRIADSNTGAMGQGSSGTAHAHGPRGFPTAGTTTTITTSLNLQRGLKGYKIRIIAGPNAGTEAVIKSNTVGTNSIITVETPFGSAITTASEFILMTGRIWLLGAGINTANTFKYYDVALNTWTAGGFTGLPTINQDTKLIAMGGKTYVTGTATAGTSTTLTNSAKTWTVNNWTNYQVRITSGTGAGQFRSIASNTATVLTVSAAWAITPDATSVYAIEGNDDHIIMIGNAATTVWRYSISGGTWTNLTMTTPRAAVTLNSFSGNLVTNVPDPTWNDETNFLNGLYIYSFRGAGSTILDRYNIATAVWENDIVYSPKVTAATSGGSWTILDGYIIQMDQTNRFYKFNIPESRFEPLSILTWPSAISGSYDRLWIVTYTDGATKLNYLYYLPITTGAPNMMFRILLF